MLFSTFTKLILLAGSVLAAPVVDVNEPGRVARRELNARGITDVDILNYALTLEHLENAFYKEGLSKYNRAAFDAYGALPRTRFNVVEIGADESAHVAFLTGALRSVGATPVAPCTYNFGLTDVASFLATANVLEGVGVSAYLGAAASIAEDAYLTAAGSILTVEARHSAYIRDSLKPPQAPFPSPFDIPLDFNQVYTLAAPFIVRCPQNNPALPVRAFPALSLAPSAPTPVRAGMSIPLNSVANLDNRGQLYCAWPSVSGTKFTRVTVGGYGKVANCPVPQGIAGQAYVIITTSRTQLTDANTVAGPAVVPIQAPYTYPGFPM